MYIYANFASISEYIKDFQKTLWEFKACNPRLWEDWMVVLYTLGTESEFYKNSYTCYWEFLETSRSDFWPAGPQYIVLEYKMALLVQAHIYAMMYL